MVKILKHSRDRSILGIGKGGGRPGNLSYTGPNLRLAIAEELTASTLSFLASIVGLEARLSGSRLERTARSSHDLLLIGEDELHLGVERPFAQTRGGATKAQRKACKRGRGGCGLC